ncbi:hypothetical protein JOD64_000782 [Micromonospora luteifusca]|uniref:Uncharacterized protein n=1 Tax=Micromonospora luteifusca TaxID=709860 RepID=A0ABS2LMZ6_9ACTN|nr:hypothetical protein [Micromonospora luteifusca]MBM7489560.1 hypothetical protein [Micromonospora luteifusca]
MIDVRGSGSDERLRRIEAVTDADGADRCGPGGCPVHAGIDELR